MSDPSSPPGGFSQNVSTNALLAADRVTAGMYVVPAGHRFRTLAFSLAFSLAGNGIMNVLNGVRNDGSKIKKEDVPFFMRPLHGLLEHNKHSDDPADRWKEVAGRSLPIIGAAIGAYVGSYNWAATSPAASANMATAKAVSEKLAAGKSIMTAEASIYADAERGHVSRIVGGIFQSLGLHSGIHQLFVPSVVNLGIGLGGAFLGANNRVLNAAGTEGLKKSTKEMADHVGRNTYNKVLAELASTPEGELEARGFLAEFLKADVATDAGKKTVDAALKQIRDGSGVNMITTYADRALNRYLVRAAKDYKDSIGRVGAALGDEQKTKIGELVAQFRQARTDGNLKPAEFAAEIEKQGQEIINKAFGNYNAVDTAGKPLPFAENDFLKTIRNAGFDEKKIEIGERNWVYRVFEWATGGAKKKAEEGLTKHYDKVAIEGGKGFPKADVVLDADIKGIGPNLGTSLLGATALVTMGGMAAAKPKATPDMFADYREREKSSGLRGFLDKKVLPKLEFVTRISIADPSWGRFWLAGGFTLGLLAGDYLMQKPFGRSVNPNIAGSLLGKIPMLPTPGFMKGIEGSLAYDPLSGTDRDRWMKNLHTFAVMGFGALGTLLGARWATKERRAKLRSEGVYLDDFEDRVTFAQGKAWEIPTAIASTPGSALGTTHFGLIPGVNYGANIANYHLLSNGGKIAWEGPGKILMGSQSKYRFGPVKLIDHMIQYAAYNPDELPKQLVDMAAGVVLPWFPDATPQQVNAFAGELLKIRNEQWQQGGIPAEKKEALIKDLTKHLRGAGLEDTLVRIGLNPAEAKLGNNGLIGQVSNIFGARSETKQLNLDYLKSLETRHPEQCQARRDRVATGTAASSTTTADLAASALAANDRNGGSFASRTAPRATPQDIVAARTGQTALQRTEISRQGGSLAPAI